MRTIQQLLIQTTGHAISFRKLDLSAEEIEYLVGLDSFLLQTDEFVFTRNPVIGPVPTPDPTEDPVNES